MKYHIVFVCLLFAFASAQQEIPATYDEPIDISAGADVYLNITVGDELGPLIFFTLPGIGGTTITVSDSSPAATSTILPKLDYASNANPSGNTPAFTISVEQVGIYALASPPLLELNDPTKHIGLLLSNVRYSELVFEIRGNYSDITKRFQSDAFFFFDSFVAIIAILDNSNSYAISIPEDSVESNPFAEPFASIVEEGQNKTLHYIANSMTIYVNSPSITTSFFAGEEELMTGFYTVWIISPLREADTNVSATLTWSFDPTTINATSLRFAQLNDTTNEWVIPTEGGRANMKDGTVTQTTTSLFGRWGVVSYNGTNPVIDGSDTSTNSEDSGESETEDNVTSSRSTDELNTDTASNVSPSTTTVNGDTSDEDNGSSSSVLISSFAMTVIAILVLF